MAGIGCTATYFIGMMSIEFQGYYVVDPGAAVGALIISLIGFITAFWIQFRLLALYPEKEVFRFLGAGIMAIGVCGCHYVSHASVVYVYDLTSHVHESKDTFVNPSADSVWIGFVVVMAFSWIVVILLITDLRTNFYERLHVISKVDALVKSTAEITVTSNCDLFSMSSFKSKYNEINSKSAWYQPLPGKIPFRLQLIGMISRSGKRVKTSFGSRPVGEFLSDVEQGRSSALRAFRKVGVLGGDSPSGESNSDFKGKGRMTSRLPSLKLHSVNSSGNSLVNSSGSSFMKGIQRNRIGNSPYPSSSFTTSTMNKGREISTSRPIGSQRGLKCSDEKISDKHEDKELTMERNILREKEKDKEWGDEWDREREVPLSYTEPCTVRPVSPTTSLTHIVTITVPILGDGNV